MVTNEEIIKAWRTYSEKEDFGLDMYLGWITSRYHVNKLGGSRVQSLGESG